jgi:hypothetical protein
MSARLIAIALASGVFLSAGSVSTAEAQLLGSRPLAVPITGSVAGGGTFVGTLSIQRFAVQGSATVAVAAIAGAIIDAPAGVTAASGLRANIQLPVTVSSAVPFASHRPQGRRFGPQFASMQCGGAVQIQVGAGSTVDVMGTQVSLNPAVIDVGAATGGLIGSLVCQILGLVGSPTMLVGVLNQLLGQLVGLTGIGGILL